MLNRVVNIGSKPSFSKVFYSHSKIFHFRTMGGINPKLKRFAPMRRKKPQSATAEPEKQPENVEPPT